MSQLEITPGMVEAGTLALAKFFTPAHGAVAIAVFFAMQKAQIRERDEFLKNRINCDWFEG